LPDITIEVARECSGIRSSIALALTCLAGSYLLLRKGWLRAALVLAVIPVAVVKNAIRIATLSLLAVHVDPGFLFGRLHHDGGFVFFGIGLGMLFCALRLFQRLERRHAPNEAASPRV
jgi:exosortase